MLYSWLCSTDILSLYNQKKDLNEVYVSVKNYRDLYKKGKSLERKIILNHISPSSAKKTDLSFDLNSTKKYY